MRIALALILCGCNASAHPPDSQPPEPAPKPTVDIEGQVDQAAAKIELLLLAMDQVASQHDAGQYQDVGPMLPEHSEVDPLDTNEPPVSLDTDEPVDDTDLEPVPE